MSGENEINQEQLICRMDGFSGAKVELIKTIEGNKIVRKTGNIERNLKQLELLKEAGYPVPVLLSSTTNSIDMEYIQGLDIKTYLRRNDVSKFVNFLCTILNKFRQTSVKKDYTNVYVNNLKYFNGDKNLPFSVDDLLIKLPKVLHCSLNHGDFTLENIIYNSITQNFTLIDVVSGDYNSYIFDISKMRQDLDGGWFIRKENWNLSPQLYIIRQALFKEFPEAFNDYVYILMLLRVYKYCKVDTQEHYLILKEIKKIWK